MEFSNTLFLFLAVMPLLISTAGAVTFHLLASPVPLVDKNKKVKGIYRLLQYPWFLFIYLISNGYILLTHHFLALDATTSIRYSLYNLGALLSGFAITWVVRFLKRAQPSLQFAFKDGEKALQKYSHFLNHTLWKPRCISMIAISMCFIATTIELCSEDLRSNSCLIIAGLICCLIYSCVMVSIALVAVIRVYIFLVSLAQLHPPVLSSSFKSVGAIINICSIASISVYGVYVMTAFVRPQIATTSLAAIAFMAFPAGICLLVSYVVCQLVYHSSLSVEKTQKIYEIETRIENSLSSEEVSMNPSVETLYLELDRITNISTWPASWRSILGAFSYGLATIIGLILTVLDLLDRL